jgi:hypothetical protein
MAKQYYAATRIKHGKKVQSKDGDPTKDRYEETVFLPGDLVEGLSTDEMRDLWNAGALEERDDSGRAEKSNDDESDDEQSDPQQPTVLRQPATAGPNATTDTVIVPDGSKQS